MQQDLETIEKAAYHQGERAHSAWPLSVALNAPQHTTCTRCSDLLDHLVGSWEKRSKRAALSIECDEQRGEGEALLLLQLVGAAATRRHRLLDLRFTASRLKLAPFCAGGKSMKV